MRIFYASDATPNGALSSSLWRNNLYLTLVDLGHDVIEFEYDLRETFRRLDSANPVDREFIRENRPRVSQELVRQIRAAHAARPIDLFFSYFYDACVLPEAIDEIRALGIRTVNWYCNGSYQLHLVSEISPHYDACLVPEKFRLEDYRAMGARPIYCQEAANPKVYRPFELACEYDVTFVGQKYGDRPEAVRFLLDRGIDVRVWGVGWASQDSRPEISSERLSRIGKRLLTREGWSHAFQKVRARISPSVPEVVLPVERLGKPLSDLEMIQMYSRSKINLGFSSCGETHRSGKRVLQVRLRDFEVPMSGGFYMVEYMEELEEFFEIGQEIVCYRDFEDLADKVQYFLKHDSERERIRRAGYERCQRDHTWHRRFESAFRQMGLG